MKLELKLEQQNKPRPKCTCETTTSNMFFLGFIKFATIDPPTNYPPTHRPPTKRLNNRIDNRNMFLLQNTSMAGKTYNYTAVYYLKSLLVSIKHIRRSQLYLFFQFINFNFYFSPDILKLLLTHGIFFSSQCEHYMFYEVIDLPKLFVVKT